jgi:hypothetical protein
MQYLPPEEHFFTFAETILSGPTKCSIIDSLAHYHSVETPYWGKTSHDGDTLLYVWNLHRANTCIMFFTIDQGGDPKTVFNPSLGMLGAPPAISLHSTPSTSPTKSSAPSIQSVISASPTKSSAPSIQSVISAPSTGRLSAGVGRGHVRSHAPTSARRIGSINGKAIYSSALKSGGVAPSSPPPLPRTRTLTASPEDGVSLTLSPPTPAVNEIVVQPTPTGMIALASEGDPPAVVHLAPAHPEAPTIPAALDNADVVPPLPVTAAPPVAADNSESTSQDSENVSGNGRHHCRCTTGCANNRCGCRKSGMKCGLDCSCDSNCKNKVTDESTPTSGNATAPSNTSISLRSNSASRASSAPDATISGDATAPSNASKSLHPSSTPRGITPSERPRRSNSSISAGASSGLSSRPPLGALKGGP